MAWQNRILRVNLTDATCNTEPLNRDWAENYLGQRGLGSKYLVEEVDPAKVALIQRLLPLGADVTEWNEPTKGRGGRVFDDHEVAAHIVEVLVALERRDDALEVLEDAESRHEDSKLLQDVRDRLFPDAD